MEWTAVTTPPAHLGRYRVRVDDLPAEANYEQFFPHGQADMPVRRWSVEGVTHWALLVPPPYPLDGPQ